MAEVPGLRLPASDEEFRRLAEVLAPAVHRRSTYAAAARLWKAKTAEIRLRRGRPHFRRHERDEFIERRAAASLADAGRREEVIGRIERRLRALHSVSVGPPQSRRRVEIACLTAAV